MLPKNSISPKRSGYLAGNVFAGGCVADEKLQCKDFIDYLDEPTPFNTCTFDIFSGIDFCCNKLFNSWACGARLLCGGNRHVRVFATIFICLTVEDRADRPRPAGGAAVPDGVVAR